MIYMTLIPVDCPDGWEPVRFGVLNDGDAYLSGYGEILLKTAASLDYGMIVKRVQDWSTASFIPDEWWVSVDMIGRIRVSEKKPTRDGTHNIWVSPSEHSFWVSSHMEWTPPKLTWADEPIQKPRGSKK